MGEFKLMKTLLILAAFLFFKADSRKVVDLRKASAPQVVKLQPNMQISLRFGGNAGTGFTWISNLPESTNTTSVVRKGKLTAGGPQSTAASMPGGPVETYIPVKAG